MLPKFHCEMNPIERCWAQAKRFTRSNCKYSIERLRKNIPRSFETISITNIENHFRKVRHYMFAFLEVHVAGPELDEKVKKYKQIYKSHRRVGVND